MKKYKPLAPSLREHLILSQESKRTGIRWVEQSDFWKRFRAGAREFLPQMNAPDCEVRYASVSLERVQVFGYALAVQVNFRMTVQIEVWDDSGDYKQPFGSEEFSVPFALLEKFSPKAYAQWSKTALETSKKQVIQQVNILLESIGRNRIS